jgi:hypothetical protein
MRGQLMKCPSCGIALQARQVNTLKYGRTANTCPHCKAAFSPTAGSVLLQLVIAVPLSLAGIFLLLHFAPSGLLEHDSSGEVARSSLWNKLVALPIVGAAFFIAHRVVARPFLRVTPLLRIS